MRYFTWKLELVSNILWLIAACRGNISKMFGYLYLSAFGLQLSISTQRTLVFLLLQKFEFTLQVKYCCVIGAWSIHFNSSSYLQLWISSSSCVHKSYTAGAFLGEELIGLSSLGAGDFILRVLIAFKICHMLSYGWAMITKIVHQLTLSQLSEFDDRSLTMARVIAIYQNNMTT